MTEPVDSAAERKRYLDTQFTPAALKLFKRYPAAQSVLLAVAQYWNDAADDAVHPLTVPCSELTPTWPDCLKAGGNALIQNDYDEVEIGEGEHGLDWGADRNGLMIVAFASYTNEGHGQDDDYGDSYTPYAIARRTPGGWIDIEIVGRMLRPEWENRGDVGYRAKA